MSVEERATVAEWSVKAPPRLWHICRDEDHIVGGCGPGCVAYCGKRFVPGNRSRGSRGVAPIDICAICQGLKADDPSA